MYAVIGCDVTDTQRPAHVMRRRKSHSKVHLHCPHSQLTISLKMIKLYIKKKTFTKLILTLKALNKRWAAKTMIAHFLIRVRVQVRYCLGAHNPNTLLGRNGAQILRCDRIFNLIFTKNSKLEKTEGHVIDSHCFSQACFLHSTFNKVILQTKNLEYLCVLSQCN